MACILVCVPALVKDKVPQMNAFSTSFPHSSFGSGEATRLEAKDPCPGRVLEPLAGAQGDAFRLRAALLGGQLDDCGPRAFE